VKITEKEKEIGTCFLTHNTFRVKKVCLSFRIGTGTNDKYVNIHINMHKLNNKLGSAQLEHVLVHG